MQPNNVKIMGIIISGKKKKIKKKIYVCIKDLSLVLIGLNITALGMSFNNGSVSLLSTSDRLRMPESVSEIPRLLPPVLNLVYNLNKLLKSTVEKLKEMNSSVATELENINFFPPCFVPAAATATNKKRKTKEGN